jgi:hypothetical protein
MIKKLLGVTFLLGLLVLGLLPARETRAFWSVGKNIHQDVTQEALARREFALLPETKPLYRFKDRAIARINKAHREADSGTYNAADHFDSESFAESYALLETRYQQMLTYLTTEEGIRYYDQQWRLFGLMLHQVQDFYSHSTWIASGHREIADFGKSLAAKTTPAFIRSAGSIGAVCEAGGVRILTPAGALTTGYYKVVPLPTGKCEHGTLENAAAGCLPLGPGPNGINLDTDCRDRPRFGLARQLAVQESVALAKALIADAYKTLGSPMRREERSFCYFIDSDALGNTCNDCCNIE